MDRSFGGLASPSALLHMSLADACTRSGLQPVMMTRLPGDRNPLVL
ncbi:MAG: hypothetical protein ABGZ17_13005 [Planctomycetaceae bacterium]